MTVACVETPEPDRTRGGDCPARLPVPGRWGRPCTGQGEYAYWGTMTRASAGSVNQTRSSKKRPRATANEYRASSAERRPSGGGHHRARRALARRRRSPPDRHGQDELAAAPARATRVHADPGRRLYGVALAPGFSVRRSRLGGRVPHGLCRPPGEPRRAGAGQPRARRPGGIHGRSDQRGHRDGLGARAGRRAHQADGLLSTNRSSSCSRHAPGAP